MIRSIAQPMPAPAVRPLVSRQGLLGPVAVLGWWAGRLRLWAVCAAVLSFSPDARALVCPSCRPDTCSLSLRGITSCEIVPQNHEIILDASCGAHLPEDAFPRLRTATGDVLGGSWERLDDDKRPFPHASYRFVGDEMPQGETFVVEGRAPPLCNMARYADGCLDAVPTCAPSSAEADDCCSAFAERGLEFDLGGNALESVTVEAETLSGSAGASFVPDDEPEFRLARFVTGPPDTTPPEVPVLAPDCSPVGTTDFSSARMSVTSSLSGVHALTLHLEKEGEGGNFTMTAAKCTAEESRSFRLSPGVVLSSGWWTASVTATDWSGNASTSELVMFQVPGDCSLEPPAEILHECTGPDFPFDAECEAEIASEPSIHFEGANLCPLFAPTPYDDDDIVPLDLDQDEDDAPSTHDDPDEDHIVPRSSGCGCRLGQEGEQAPWAAWVSAFGVLLLFARRSPRVKHQADILPEPTRRLTVRRDPLAPDNRR